jgi:hypothetical protein
MFGQFVAKLVMQPQVVAGGVGQGAHRCAPARLGDCPQGGEVDLGCGLRLLRPDDQSVWCFLALALRQDVVNPSRNVDVRQIWWA